MSLPAHHWCCEGVNAIDALLRKVGVQSDASTVQWIGIFEAMMLLDFLSVRQNECYRERESIKREIKRV